MTEAGPRPEAGHGRRAGRPRSSSGVRRARAAAYHRGMPTVELPGSAAVSRCAPGCCRRSPAAGRSTRPMGWSRSTPRGGSRSRAAASGAPAGVADGAVDLRPWVVLPGMVDLHAHLPQLPERRPGLRARPADLARPADVPDRAVVGRPRGRRPRCRRRSSGRSPPPGRRRCSAYGVVYEAAMDEAFRAAEAHGIRAILGKVMMDRVTYDPTIEPSTILERSLRESAGLISRWHGAGGRAARLRGHAAVRRLLHRGAPPRVGVARPLDRRVVAVARVRGRRARSRRSRGSSPRPRDYVDVYDRAGALGSRSVLAHAIHLSDREVARIVETGHARRPLPGLEPVHRGRA